VMRGMPVVLEVEVCSDGPVACGAMVSVCDVFPMPGWLVRCGPLWNLVIGFGLKPLLRGENGGM
jgi:hypothetical protein